MARTSKRKSATAKSPATAAPPVDWSTKTVVQLKKECTDRKLEITGKKADLVKRIEDDESGTTGPPAKIAKQNTLQTAMETVKTSAKAEKNKKKTYKVDQHCSLFGAGEPGAHSLKGPFEHENAKKDFEKKFNDKTKNAWENRSKFKAVAGKYTMLDMGDEEDEPSPLKQVALSPAKGGLFQKTKPLSLDKATSAFVQLIFDLDMFKEALISLSIDIKKLPLGKLSKPQIVKGFEVLDKINTVLDASKKTGLTELSNQFYTLVPHDFGRQRPPIINDKDLLRKKMDLLLTLGDIEIAQGMLKNQNDSFTLKANEDPPHYLDVQYEMLKCTLDHIQVKDKQFGIIEQYLKSTSGSRVKKIINIWRMDRVPEQTRFKAHDNIGHRKLLWHGTNLAVVAAILKSGLRIMPHSGGRVGKGIYFASENSKSAGYVGTVKKTGVMFLNEVALGKEKHIGKDDHTLTKAPAGFDSIVAKGRVEPDPTKDAVLTLDGHKVYVPQGKPIAQSQWQTSSFCQSEYLVYKESQVRMRYCLQLEFDY